MLDDDDAPGSHGALRLLERTPPDTPAFTPALEVVVRRSTARRRRRLAGRSVLALALVAAVALPLLALTGLLGGSSARFAAGDGHPLKLIQYYEPSGSMDPTVRVGQTVLVDTNAYLGGRFPRTGDLIVFRWRTQGQTFELLKRVIGLPGQTVVIRRGAVFVDGRRLDEPYLNRHRDLRDYGPFVVRPGHVFVLGDNRINSNDSRYDIGQVPMSNVMGKMVGFTNGKGIEPPTAGSVQGPGTP